MAVPALSYRVGRQRELDRSCAGGGRVNHSLFVSRAREGGPSASGFDAGDAELWGRLRLEPIETAGRGAHGRVCALAFQAG
jgi:hypothetical protein